jgi:hypothetical protein
MNRLDIVLIAIQGEETVMGNHLAFFIGAVMELRRVT